jgi:basic membrane protein A
MLRKLLFLAQHFLKEETFMRNPVKIIIFATLAFILFARVLAATPAPTSPSISATSTPAPRSAPAAAATTTKTYKLAAIFPGTITDADYNTLGYLGLQAVQGELGVKVAYSENVAVPDVEHVIRKYVDGGSNIVWTHGSQFISQTENIAKQFKDVIFIAETDGPEPNAPDNVWIIDRNYHVGFYALGYLAAKTTKTGKISYLGGLRLPFSYAEYHAVEQALKDAKSTATLKGVWTGDFNDPTKARQVADAMIADGDDVILGSLNLGMLGLFESVKAQKTKILVTAKYTDKSSYAPNNVMTSLLYNFIGPMKDIVKQIQGGKRGGYYPLGFATGVDLQFPLKNVSPDVNTQLQRVVNDLKTGKITVNKDSTPLK